MSLLFNPWVILALVVSLAGTHFTAYRTGRQHVRTEWQASVSKANEEARRLEQRRQDRADEAGQVAAERGKSLRADAARAGDAVGRLRDAIAAQRLTAQSQAAAIERANTYGQLLGESAAAYRELAATCDKHLNDLRMVLEAWPQ